MSEEKTQCQKSKEEQDKEWLEERRAKKGKDSRVRKSKKSEAHIVERESEELAEELLVKTAFSALL